MINEELKNGIEFDIMGRKYDTKDWIVNQHEFNSEFEKHQDLSRTAAAGKFK